MQSIFELRTATAEFRIEISKSSDAAGVERFTGLYAGNNNTLIVHQIESFSDFEHSRILKSGILTAGTEEDLVAQFRSLVQKHGEILD